MARNFRKSKFKDGIGNPVKPNNTTILTSGPVNNEVTMKKANVKKAYQDFSKKKMINNSNSMDARDLAPSVLAALGCSILDMPLDYSLLEAQTDQEKLLNPNIIDIKIADLRPVAISAINNMGTNNNDPFWNLDTGPLLSTKNLNLKPEPRLIQMDATQITAELINYNMSPLTTTLKEFK